MAKDIYAVATSKGHKAYWDVQSNIPYNQTLGDLVEHGGQLTVQEAADAFGLDPATLKIHLNSLSKQGYVALYRDPVDEVRI